MAKTLEKIERQKVMADEFFEVSRAKLIAMLKVSRSELARSNEKLASAEDANSKAWGAAADWKERCQKVEDDNRTLEKERDNLDKVVEKLAGQLNRCMGFIAAKLEEHPAEEAKPDNYKAGDGALWQHDTYRHMHGEPVEQRKKTWREYLGLDQ